MFSIIPLPTGFTADILDNVGIIIADLSPFLTLIISVIFIGLVLEIIIGAMRK